MKLKPDLQVSNATAQAIVDQVDNPQTVAKVFKLHGGEIAAIYAIEFADPAHAPLVLKVYPDALWWKMQKEVTVLGLIQNRLGVAVPRILLADGSKRLLDLSFALMTRLEGSILGELEPTLRPQQRLAAYAQIGQLLREFHRIPMHAFGYIGSTGIWTPHSTNQAYLTHQFARKLREFIERGGAAGLAEQVAKYVASGAELLNGCSRAVLCHNDLHAGNLLATNTEGGVQLSGVLDFEGALAGDPLMDVAKALYYLDAECKSALLEGYGPIDRTLWPQTLDFYRLYFVLELWCWMAQIGKKEALGKLSLELESCSQSYIAFPLGT